MSDFADLTQNRFDTQITHLYHLSSDDGHAVGVVVVSLRRAQRCTA
jgi:hypothetical protein